MKTLHGKLVRRIKIKRTPTEPYDCKNCEHACPIDGICNWPLHPDYDENKPYPCKKEEENKHE
jgi:hypothetical protein